MDVANALNLHFASIAQKLDTSHSTNASQHSSHSSCASHTFSTPSAHKLKDLPFLDLNQLTMYFKDIDTKKATGSDGLSVKILRLALPFIAPILSDIINRAIADACFPKQWKNAVVTPLYKGGDKEDLSNYRPISVLPILSKIYERHILKHLSAYLENHNLISSSQSGFRKNHSCNTAVHHLITKWLDAKKTKDSTVLLFLDFWKAFDMVRHDIILAKLVKLGITGKFLNTLKSYLLERYQSVKVGNALSTSQPILRGVPQGSILAPTLFSIFINDLLLLPLNPQVHAYADDTTFYISDRNPSQLHNLLTADIAMIEQWCTSTVPTKW